MANCLAGKKLKMTHKKCEHGKIKSQCKDRTCKGNSIDYYMSKEKCFDEVNYLFY